MNLSHRYGLRFGFHSCEIPDGHCHAHGLAFSNVQSFNDYCTYGYASINPFDNPRIVLNENYLRMLDVLDGRALEVVQLCIAITILHELAHVVWKCRVGGDLAMTPDGIRTGEPGFDKTDKQTLDLGFALERNIFGGGLEIHFHDGDMVPYYSAGFGQQVIVPMW